MASKNDEAIRILRAEVPPDSQEYQDWLTLTRQYARTSMIAYIRRIAPWFTIEEVHLILAAHYEAVLDGEIDRQMIFLAPRAGKSQMGSVFMPSMYAGRYPSDKILQVGHSVELSRGFSLQVRDIMQDPEYGLIFPGVQLAKDAKAAGKWQVENIHERMAALEGKRQRVQRGQYNAAGVTSNIAGKGFNLGLPDDVMSEQDKDSKLVKDRIWNWWGPGFYTRRQPERNAIILTMTRWAKDDLAGHLIELMNERHHGADVWNILNIPAILDGDTARKIYLAAKNMEDTGLIEEVKELKAGDSFAPRRWTLKELMRSKAAMRERDWNALYMGNPTDEEGNLLKKRYWRLWPSDEPPVCDYIFQTYDTAFDEDTANDYSARTTWGIFTYKPENGRPAKHMILLDRWRRHVDAPDLKYFVMAGCYGGKMALKYIKEQQKFNGQPVDVAPYLKGEGALVDDDDGLYPDHVIIENKASGIWLTKELRRIHKPRAIPIRPWNAPRSGRGKELGKYARAALGSEVLEQGSVWYMNRKWANEVIDLCAECRFDGSDDSDDLQDTVTTAMIFVRQTYRVEMPTDVDEEAEKRVKLNDSTKRKFYGAR